LQEQVEAAAAAAEAVMTAREYDDGYGDLRRGDAAVTAQRGAELLGHLQWCTVLP
jgi:hypothetical protein